VPIDNDQGDIDCHERSDIHRHAGEGVAGEPGIIALGCNEEVKEHLHGLAQHHAPSNDARLDFVTPDDFQSCIPPSRYAS
jgi:hypothetical protein